VSWSAWPRMEPDEIFVFGSNLAGRHGAGAALHARKHLGAKNGFGLGRTGQAYALPTKDVELRTLPLGQIEIYIALFLHYAEEHPDLRFYVTRIGCGLAGYTEEEMRPLFKGAPLNCRFTWTEP
jgi:hypothetical protein